MACDLHLHSNSSDGLHAPAEVFKMAEACGLTAAALTDHNTVSGISEFQNAAKESIVEAVAGIELTTEWNHNELHLVGLWLSGECRMEVPSFVGQYNKRKELSNLQLTERLKAAGFPITYDEIVAMEKQGTLPNRSTFALWMKNHGYVSEPKEAFEKYLSSEAGFYVPPKRISIVESIDFLRQHHAVPVLAHPFQLLPEAQLPELLTVAKAAGLIGIEVAYSSHTEKEYHAALAYANQFGLLPGGGSDFHGEAKKRGLKVGVGYGNLLVPDEWYACLKNAAGQ